MKGAVFAAGVVVGAVAVGVPSLLAMDAAAKLLEMHARIIAGSIGVKLPVFDKRGNPVGAPEEGTA